MKPIRVALSGSGFKFPAHVGALLAIRDAGFEPIEYAGTSGGSIIAALAAAGMPLDDMRQLVLEHDWSSMLTFSPWTLLTKGAWCSGNALHDWLDANTGGKAFAELPVPLTVVSSDMETMRQFVFSEEATPRAPVALAVRASASIPMAYAPVDYEDAFLLQDGGMADNIPADLLVKDDVPRLGVQLIAAEPQLERGTHLALHLLTRDVTLMLDMGERAHVALARESGANVAAVETGYASSLDRNMAQDIRQRLLHDGYDATMEELSKIEKGASFSPSHRTVNPVVRRFS